MFSVLFVGLQLRSIYIITVMWIIFVTLLFSASVSAMTDAEAKADFMKIALSCMKDHPLEMADLLKLRSLELPDKYEAKCLLACTYRKYGSMNDQGTFDLDKSYELAEKAKAGEEKAIANGKKLADVCIKVNDEVVSDGSKGCQRAGLMFKCFVENAPKFGFTI